MNVLKTIIWRLSGFLIFGAISWGFLTLSLMLPDVRHSWAAWAVAGVLIVKTALVMFALIAGYLSFSWLRDPAEID